MQEPSDFQADLDFIGSLSEEEKLSLLESLKDKQPALMPLPGPQTMACESDADITLYGGAAGGGKTYLAVILALTRHRRTLLIRKERQQLYAVEDEIEGIMKSREGFNSQNGIWRLPNNEITDPYKEFPNRQVRFGGLNNPGDAAKYQGAPRDLLIIDEAANISYEEFIFLTVWERTAESGQNTRTLLCSNPPVDATGMWMVPMFAPWLDESHENPAKPGELRWFLVVGEDASDMEHIEVNGPGEYEVKGEIYSAESRTFIPAKVDDNPHMIASGYKKKLQRLPKHLRERMLHGKFLASLEDGEFQVIPTEWVEMAMKRWRKRAEELGASPDASRMDAMGVDCARGGSNNMTICCRHHNWYSEIIKIPGVEVPTGGHGAARVIMARRDQCQINIDSIGIGSSVYDKLGENIPATELTGIVGNEREVVKGQLSKDGLYQFKNFRAMLYWQFMESLNPESGDNVMLPPDKRMAQDLCAPTYKILEGNVIQIESKELIKKRLRRSTDDGDAIVYASYGAPARSDLRRASKRFKVKRCIG